MAKLAKSTPGPRSWYLLGACLCSSSHQTWILQKNLGTAFIIHTFWVVFNLVGCPQVLRLRTGTFCGTLIQDQFALSAGWINFPLPVESCRSPQLNRKENRDPSVVWCSTGYCYKIICNPPVVDRVVNPCWSCLVDGWRGVIAFHVHWQHWRLARATKFFSQAPCR
jgi:hypothetical protein